MLHNTFTHALTRYPTENIADGLTSQTLGKPDIPLAFRQYEGYLAVLRELGLTVQTLPGDERYPDGCFVEDAAIIYEGLFVITQPGAESRFSETEAIAEALKGYDPLFMQGDARLDGGDVLFCADRVLIGQSERTNREGAEQLRGLLQYYDATIRVDIVPFRGLLHLKSGVTELAPNVLIKSPLLKTDYPFDFAEVHTIPAAETIGADVLPINDAILIAAGFPSVARLAERYHTRIFALPISEFAKMDGGMTCLSLRYQG